ncbi:hypothetical protein X777_12916 [Ooceraea biroi]|uniref:Uncharacterized protein n=1 Tax=Ooceraea biroi TaxID=2015173 RepID=A0A026W1D8_OOCBI|nr:hypothetical protein X777_12916 [Ooceraea biroi]
MRDGSWAVYFFEHACTLFQDLRCILLPRFARRSVTEMTTLTEFEESVSFDADDPDFAPSSTAVRGVLRTRCFTDVKFDVSTGKRIFTLFESSPCHRFSGVSVYLIF